MVQFKTIVPGQFFLFCDEPYVRTTGDDEKDNANANAFNMLGGMLVCFDSDWRVTKISYAKMVRQFFPEILNRCIAGRW